MDKDTYILSHILSHTHTHSVEHVLSPFPPLPISHSPSLCPMSPRFPLTCYPPSRPPPFSFPPSSLFGERKAKVVRRKERMGMPLSDEMLKALADAGMAFIDPEDDNVDEEEEKLLRLIKSVAALNKFARKEQRKALLKGDIDNTKGLPPVRPYNHHVVPVYGK